MSDSTATSRTFQAPATLPNTWRKYLTDYNEGLGLVYERFVLNDFLEQLRQQHGKLILQSKQERRSIKLQLYQLAMLQMHHLLEQIQLIERKDSLKQEANVPQLLQQPKLYELLNL